MANDLMNHAKRNQNGEKQYGKIVTKYPIIGQQQKIIFYLMKKKIYMLNLVRPNSMEK